MPGPSDYIRLNSWDGAILGPGMAVWKRKILLCKLRKTNVPLLLPGQSCDSSSEFVLPITALIRKPIDGFTHCRVSQKPWAKLKLPLPRWLLQVSAAVTRAEPTSGTTPVSLQFAIKLALCVSVYFTWLPSIAFEFYKHLSDKKEIIKPTLQMPKIQSFCVYV